MFLSAFGTHEAHTNSIHQVWKVACFTWRQESCKFMARLSSRGWLARNPLKWVVSHPGSRGGGGGRESFASRSVRANALPGSTLWTTCLGSMRSVKVSGHSRFFHVCVCVFGKLGADLNENQEKNMSLNFSFFRVV